MTCHDIPISWKVDINMSAEQFHLHYFYLMRSSKLGKGLVLLLLLLPLMLGTKWVAVHSLKKSIANSAKLPAEFNYTKIITVVAFDRFEYYRECIEGLRTAWGSNEYIIIINVDGRPTKPGALYNSTGYDNIVTFSNQLKWLAEAGVGFKDVIVSVAETQLGLHKNKKRAVQAGFNLSDFVIVVEDDVVFSPDALRWFEWHVSSGLIFNHTDIALATCYALPFPYDSNSLVEAYDLLAVSHLGLLDKYFLRHGHCPWGWAIWRRPWEDVQQEWTGQDLDLLRLVIGKNWFESQPMVARCNNVGLFGVHKRGPGHGSIHRRLVTSSNFLKTESCAYNEIKRGNTSLPFEKDYSHLFELLRWGFNLVKQNTTLVDMRNKMSEWKLQQPSPQFWVSTC